MAIKLTIITLAVFCAAEFAYAIYDVWREEREAKKEKRNEEDGE